jgi:uncharacterized membrane protein
MDFLTETHFSIVFFFLTPVYYFFQAPPTLFIFSIVAITITGLAIRRIAMYEFNSKIIGYVFLLMFILHPATVNLYTMGFRFVMFGMMFSSLAFLAYYKGNFPLFTAFILLTAVSKEDLPLLLIGLGFFILVHRKLKGKLKIRQIIKSKWVLTPIVIGVSAFLVINLAILTEAGIGRRYRHLGDDPLEIVENIITNPIQTIGLVLRENNLEFCDEMLRPAGYLSLLAPEYFLIVAFPFFEISLASPESSFMANIYWWYHAPLLPFVFISAMVGLKRLAGLLSILADKIDKRVKPGKKKAVKRTVKKAVKKVFGLNREFFPFFLVSYVALVLGQGLLGIWPPLYLDYLLLLLIVSITLFVFDVVVYRVLLILKSRKILKLKNLRSGLCLGIVLLLLLNAVTQTNLMVKARNLERLGERPHYLKYLENIPQEASVSAQWPFLAFLSSRSRIYEFPEGVGEADYIVLHIGQNPYPLRSVKELMTRMNEILENGQYVVAENRGSFRLLLRTDSEIGSVQQPAWGEKAVGY